MEVTGDTELEGRTEPEAEGQPDQDQASSHWKPVRRNFATDAEFFQDGDIVCGLMRKQTLPVPDDSNGEDAHGDEQSEDHDSNSSFCCHIATCKKTFTSVASYEMHYSALHRNVCTQCYRHFPNTHLLDIHIQEWHNPMFQLLAAKQNMYQCLVETCEERFATTKERKNHLIKVHKYPSNFRFDRPLVKKKTPTEKKSKVASDTPCSEQMNTEAVSIQAENQSGHTVKRQFVHSIPKTICFGQGAQRGFQRPAQGKKKGRQKKHWHQQHCDSGEDMDTAVNIEEVKLGDLAQALESS